MREIVFDTETTGLDPESGHRVVEIGCLELINHLPTGRSFQCYINPERDMPEGAFAVHGLSAEFLSGHPVFAAVADEFLTFVGDSRLVIHNAAFDLKFINAELKRVNKTLLDGTRATDTVEMARRKFPGAPASLDALCKRFNVDNSQRTKHGALLDAELLAEVYLELIGGRQATLSLAGVEVVVEAEEIVARVHRSPRAHVPTDDELAAHQTLLAKIKDPVWLA